MAAGTTVIINGVVDLPDATGSIGDGEIITYADSDLVDIYTNGSRIDYILTDFGLEVIDSLAFDANEHVFMTQRAPVRAGYVGEFRAVLKSALSIATTDFIYLRMAMRNMKGNLGGFALSARPLICEFIRMDTNEQIGCKVSSVADTSMLNHFAISYTLQPT